MHMEVRNMLEYIVLQYAYLIMLSGSLCCKGLKNRQRKAYGIEWKGQHKPALSS